MPAGEPIIVDTLAAALRHGYAISAHCSCCGRSVYLNLPTVIALDGDRSLMSLQVRCSKCGRRGAPNLVPLGIAAGHSYPRW